MWKYSIAISLCALLASGAACKADGVLDEIRSAAWSIAEDSARDAAKELESKIKSAEAAMVKAEVAIANAEAAGSKAVAATARAEAATLKANADALKAQANILKNTSNAIGGASVFGLAYNMNKELQAGENPKIVQAKNAGKELGAIAGTKLAAPLVALGCSTVINCIPSLLLGAAFVSKTSNMFGEAAEMVQRNADKRAEDKLKRDALEAERNKCRETNKNSSYGLDDNSADGYDNGTGYGSDGCGGQEDTDGEDYVGKWQMEGGNCSFPVTISRREMVIPGMSGLLGGRGGLSCQGLPIQPVEYPKTWRGGISCTGVQTVPLVYTLSRVDKDHLTMQLCDYSCSSPSTLTRCRR